MAPSPRSQGGGGPRASGCPSGSASSSTPFPAGNCSTDARSTVPLREEVCLGLGSSTATGSRASWTVQGGAEELRAELKAELASGLELLRRDCADPLAELKAGLQLLQGKWGDPLDDKSRFREGLRAELQVQLHIALAGLDGQILPPTPGTFAQACEVKCAQCIDVPSGASLMSLKEEEEAARVGEALFEPFEPGAAAASGLCEVADRRDLRGDKSAPEGAPRDDALAGCRIADASARDMGSESARITGAQTDASEITASAGLQSWTPRARTRGSSMHILAQASFWEAPEGSSRFAQLRRACAKLVHRNYYFDMVMGIMIIANSITVGLEIQWDLDEATEKMKVAHSLEHMFLSVFVLELGIRVLADGAKVRESGWFIFDSVLVFIGGVSTWVIDPIMQSVQGGEGASEETFSAISQVLVIRVLRLLRLVRALRLLEQFQQLWKLANGLMGSIRTVLSAWLLVMITVYIFACLGIELVTRNASLQEDNVCKEIVELHFPSVLITMLTIVQFANADSIASVYTPLIAKEWYLAFYFGIVWLIVTISLMNLVTGVIVENAISLGSVDKEMELFAKRKMLRNLQPTIEEIFKALDKSGDGMLQLSEVKHGLDKLEQRGTLPAELQAIIQEDKLVDLFSFLDADDSGEVDKEEFLDGIFHLALQSVPIETTQTLQLLRGQAHQLQLLRNLACAQACQGGVVALSKDHRKGDSALDVELDRQAVHINGGGRSEDKLLQANTFSMRLDSPLRRSFPRQSIVSKVNVEAQSGLDARASSSLASANLPPAGSCSVGFRQ